MHWSNTVQQLTFYETVYVPKRLTFSIFQESKCLSALFGLSWNCSNKTQRTLALLGARGDWIELFSYGCGRHLFWMRDPRFAHTFPITVTSLALCVQRAAVVDCVTVVKKNRVLLGRCVILYCSGAKRKQITREVLGACWTHARARRFTICLCWY